MKIWAIVPSGSEPETNSRPQGFDAGGVEFCFLSSSMKRQTSRRTASRWFSSPLKCGNEMVMLPRSQDALMREPRLFVAGMYLL